MSDQTLDNDANGKKKRDGEHEDVITAVSPNSLDAMRQQISSLTSSQNILHQNLAKKNLNPGIHVQKQMNQNRQIGKMKSIPIVNVVKNNHINPVSMFTPLSTTTNVERK
jgi:hypothetical protein